MAGNPRVSPWIGEAAWSGAREKAKQNDASFGDDLAALVHAYAEGLVDIDPRMIPDTDPTRAGHAVYPDPDDWKDASERASREHGVSASVMMECLVTRYWHGHLKLRRTVEVIEVQPLRKNRMQNKTPFRGLRGISLALATVLYEKPNLTVKELARATSTTEAVARTTIERMEKKGTAARSDVKEGRSITWSLTPQALEETDTAKDSAGARERADS